MRLLFSSIVLSLLAGYALGQSKPAIASPFSLVFEHSFEVSTIPTSTGTALALGGGGELYLLTDNPPQITKWDSNRHLIGQFSDDSFISPTDIYCNSSITLLIADPFQNTVMLADRHLKQLDPVEVKLSDEQFEPLSICRGRDGTMFIINRADNDLWRVERNGRATSFKGNEGGWLTDPVRVRYLNKSDELILLDGNQLVVCSKFGSKIRTIPTLVERPVNFNVTDGELWIIGEGVSVVNFSDGKLIHTVPSDSLKSWKVYPASDILPYDGGAYILDRDGIKAIQMNRIQ